MAPSRRQIWRRGFDERYDFVAVRELRFTDGTVRVGEVLDKAQTTPRRLRQLYDARWIDVAREVTGPGVTYPSTLAPEAAEAGPPSPPSQLPSDAAEAAPEAEPEPVEYVPLPAGWRDLSAMDIRRMAEALTGERITSKAVAVERLEEYDRARPA